MAASGGGTATAAAHGQQQQKQGGPQQSMQNKRPSRWTGSHSFGTSNPNSGSTGTQQVNARAQSPLNPGKGNAAAPGSTAAPAAAPGAPNHAAAATPPFANITTSPEELAKMHDRMLFLFANLVGHKVRCTLRTGVVYTAILSTVNDADLSVCLKLARQIEPPPPQTANGDASGAVASAPALPPPKAALVVSAKDVIDIYAENVSLDAATFSSSVPGASRPTSPNASTAAANQSAMNNIMAALGGDTFRTDTDISGTGTSREQRELQRWGTGDALGGGLEDGLEGAGAGLGSSRAGKGGAWDQFAVNERLFGTKTNYQEEIYTTKLDKSGADYKAREARAAKIAEEIQSGAALNSHVAEERGGPTSFTDDSGMDEEDKYSGVQRSQNAYVPPGARRALAIQTPPAAVAKADNQLGGAKANGVSAQAAQPPATAVDAKVAPPTARLSPAVSVAQPAPATSAPQNKEDLVGDFKKFVTNEKEKLVQKRTQLEKQNKDKKMAELKSWSATFVLKTPIPADLVPILAKDEEKQKEISNRKATPSAAAAITNAAGPNAPKPASTHTSPNPQATALKGPSISSTQLPPRLGGVPQPPAADQKRTSAWAIPSIPPFDPQRAAAARAAKAAAAASPAPEGKPAVAPASSTKFNVAAKEFVFRPNAGAFVPGAAAGPGAATSTPPAAAAPSAVPATSSAAVPAITKSSEHVTPTVTARTVAPQPLNPFFGTRLIRNNNAAPFRVKEDFSPFKRNEKIPDPATVQPAWGFTGKTYKAVASYSFPGTSGAAHAVSPQPSHALPPHMQQNANGRVLVGVASPPLSSQASHLSRASSSQGQANHSSSIATSGPSSEDGGMGKAGLATPVPSSSTSASGIPTPSSGQLQHPSQTTGQGQAMHVMPGQPHMVPQQFVFQPQPGQQYPTFRYATGGAGAHQQAGSHAQGQGGQQVHHPHMTHQQLQQFQQMQQQQQMHGHQLQGQPATHIIMGPNGQPMTVTTHGQFFSPPPGQPMFSQQMAGQMPPGQHFMQPMFVAQQGNMRGQNGQMTGGQHAPQVFYPQMQGAPAMHPQFVQMGQHPGMAMTPSQPMFEQAGQ